MKKPLTINGKTRTLLFIMAGLLAAGILLVSCGGGGYGGGGGMNGGGMSVGAFALSMPGNGQTGISLTPMLMWNPSAGATSYAVQIKVGAAMTYTTLGTVMPPMTSFTVTTPLLPSTLYDWQVTASGIYGPIMAGPFSFTTGTM
jgi:hypothetical protein